MDILDKLNAFLNEESDAETIARQKDFITTFYLKRKAEGQQDKDKARCALFLLDSGRLKGKDLHNFDWDLCVPYRKKVFEENGKTYLVILFEYKGKPPIKAMRYLEEVTPAEGEKIRKAARLARGYGGGYYFEDD